MKLSIFRKRTASDTSLLSSGLFNETTFYKAFTSDLRGCKDELIIESPFMTSRRLDKLLPALRLLRTRGVRVTINTRDPEEHDEYFRLESQDAVATLQGIGVHVLYTGGHHRKLAIIDRKILWEGSLNILSQFSSCEVMRRIESNQLAEEMVNFIKLRSFLS